MGRIHLLVIDPQNDFCDLPQDWLPPGLAGGKVAPALPVPGAHADLLRLADWLDAHAREVDDVTVTLDHHHRIDIAHPGFWRTPEGEPPQPFTQVSSADLDEGRIRTARPEDRDHARSYLRTLEATGRFTHMVWPVHCQIGTWGQSLHAGLQASLDRWEDLTGRAVRQVLKGENPRTEHYSALRAEVPVPGDPSTELNTPILRELERADLLVVAGEAGSHCVRATVEHILGNWSGPAGHLVLARDAMSPVGGFEAAQAAFLESAAAAGARVLALSEVP